MSAHTEARRLARELAEIDRALRALERSGQLTGSSIEDGALSAYDLVATLRQIIGRQPDDRFTITDHGGPPPPVPTGVTAEILLGGAAITWDGTFVEDFQTDGTYSHSPRPADAKYVEVHAAPVPEYVPTNATQVGTIVSPNGGRVVVGLSGDVEWFITLVSVSSSYVESDPSEPVSVVPLPALYTRFYQDTLTVEAKAAEHVIPLTFQPTGGSEHVYWNRWYQPGDRWFRRGGTIVVPDDGRFIKPGDLLTVEYAHGGADAPPPPPPEPSVDLGLNYRGSSTGRSDHDGGTGTITLPIPPNTQTGDTVVVVTAASDAMAATVNDPRLTKIGDMMATGGVYVGRILTEDRSPVVVTTTGTLYSSAALATYGAFLDFDRKVNTYSVSPPGVVQGLTGDGSGAIVCMATVYGTGGSYPSLPTIADYAVVARTGIYYEALIAHTEAGVVTAQPITWPGNAGRCAQFVIGVQGGAA